MLAIGRALMAEPSIGLAPLYIQEIFEVIKKLNAQGTTILLVEQNAKVALSITDFAYVRETDNLVLRGTGKDLLDNPCVKEAYLATS